MMKKENFKLQFITHSNERYDTVSSARIALQGGCKWIQLRMKDASPQLLKEAALNIKALCREHNATFIIDDNVELVKEVGADGVHLGLLDMPIREARKILGESFIIGGTANTFDNILQHYHDGADYIGCGPFRFTTTKKKLSPILGLDGYSKIINSMKSNNINIPIVAIGGICRRDIATIIHTGVNGIAMSGGILNAIDPVNETKEIMEEIDRTI